MTKDLRINQGIRAREVRLIGAEGEQLGIVPFFDALRMAEEKGFDLVEVAPQARPVVCKIMDYGRYKYEQSKRDKESRKKQHVVSLKEVKMRPNIEDHDFDVKAKNAIRFLQDGDKVKVTLMFRGREIVHPHLGQQILRKLAEQVQDMATVERHPKLEGRNMIMILAPTAQKQE
ncbi:MAG: translation initiation factor IF-3 [Eubacteriales bacterium]|nr:translation initiation factor IF-3 [Desulforudis sp.]MDP3044115.1 translation initiation factor IF-3 [Bacillota bacterium]MDP3050349.1 translation initiation factor IF-3 [Eubacteriales bacterium]MBV1735376.1 translation initiation factor IF-3 [Desulforudis sp.]MBV1768746.1 translation initiation factor IF-3 [Desulforudis sp.]